MLKHPPIKEQTIGEYEESLQWFRDHAAPVMPVNKIPGMKVPNRYAHDINTYYETTGVGMDQIRQLFYVALTEQFIKKHNGFAFFDDRNACVQVENIMVAYGVCEFQITIMLVEPIAGWARSAGVENHTYVQELIDQGMPIIRANIRIDGSGNIQVIGQPYGAISMGTGWQQDKYVKEANAIIPVFIENLIDKVIYEMVIWPICYHYIFKMPTFTVTDLHTGEYNLVFLDNEIRRIYAHMGVPYKDNDTMEIKFRTLRDPMYKRHPLYQVEKAIAVKENWRGKREVIHNDRQYSLIRY